MPQISVIIPLYNKEQTIARASRSVLRQTVPDFEVIVVDDGSTDAGPRLAESTGDARLRLLRQANQGVSAARNRGVAEARSPWEAFLDADDEWKPTFLERIRHLANRFPDASVLATSYVFCGADGRAWYPLLRGIPPRPWEGVLPDYFAVAARSDPPLWSSAVAVKREALLAVGGFPVGITSGEDLLTWARLAVNRKVALATEPLAVFHVGNIRAASGPCRLPDAGDPVGRELLQLGKEVPPHQQASFRRYVALWNKMRASVLLRVGQRTSARRHALRAVALDPRNWRNHVLLAFTLLPCQSRQLFAFTLQVRRKHRGSGNTP